MTGQIRGTVALIGLVLMFMFGGTASTTEFVASAGPAAEPSPWAAPSAYSYDIGPTSSESTFGAGVASTAAWAPAGGLSTNSTGDLSVLRSIFVAAETGGAASVRLDQAGEAAVRGAYDIGPKATRVIDGRTRIFDGLNDSAVSDVKNVGYQAYTQQLKDSLAYAQENGLQFNLYVRGGANPTVLSGPLQDAIANTPGFNLRFIP